MEEEVGKRKRERGVLEKGKVQCAMMGLGRERASANSLYIDR